MLEFERAEWWGVVVGSGGGVVKLFAGINSFGF